MAKRRVGIMSILLCFCLAFSPCYVGAASTSDTSQPINTAAECALTLSCTYDGTAFAAVPVKLYKVAAVSADFQYTLTDSFAPSGLLVNGIRSTDEWNAVRSTLEARTIADDIEADGILKTDANGQVRFEALKPGLYLAVVGSVTQGGRTCFFGSGLASLPDADQNGEWQYQVSVALKAEMMPPSEEEAEYKVIKLWKGDEGGNSRPRSVEVEIFRDGTSYKKVVLTGENNWSYSWTSKQDGATWTAIERNTPSGYTVTVEQRANTLVLTNTFVPEHPDEPSDGPQTGDTTNVMLYVMLMIVSGCIFIILGMTGKRNAHEEN